MHWQLSLGEINGLAILGNLIDVVLHGLDVIGWRWRRILTAPLSAGRFIDNVTAFRFTRRGARSAGLSTLLRVFTGISVTVVCGVYIRVTLGTIIV